MWSRRREQTCLTQPRSYSKCFLWLRSSLPLSDSSFLVRTLNTEIPQAANLLFIRHLFKHVWYFLWYSRPLHYFLNTSFQSWSIFPCYPYLGRSFSSFSDYYTPVYSLRSKKVHCLLQELFLDTWRWGTSTDKAELISYLCFHNILPHFGCTYLAVFSIYIHYYQAMSIQNFQMLGC